LQKFHFLSQLPLLRSRYQTQRERILERIEKEKNLNIKAEPKKGKFVEIIENGLDY
jgi:hypothetical protein